MIRDPYAYPGVHGQSFPALPIEKRELKIAKGENIFKQKDSGREAKDIKSQARPPLGFLSNCPLQKRGKLYIIKRLNGETGDAGMPQKADVRGACTSAAKGANLPCPTQCFALESKGTVCNRMKV
jgi:hypothetical protein